jgi:hypothetical protein
MQRNRRCNDAAHETRLSRAVVAPEPNGFRPLKSDKSRPDRHPPDSTKTRIV